MKNQNSSLGFGTLAIHAGQAPDPTTGAVMTPIYMTSTYAQESPGKHRGFEYSRTQNPTRFALQDCVAALEKGKYGLAFASGCAALATVMHMFKSGDPVWLPLNNGGTAAILFCFACLYLSTAGGGPYSVDAKMGRS